MLGILSPFAIQQPFKALMEGVSNLTQVLFWKKSDDDGQHSQRFGHGWHHQVVWRTRHHYHESSAQYRQNPKHWSSVHGPRKALRPGYHGSLRNRPALSGSGAAAHEFPVGHHEGCALVQPGFQAQRPASHDDSEQCDLHDGHRSVICRLQVGHDSVVRLQRPH